MDVLKTEFKNKILDVYFEYQPYEQSTDYSPGCSEYIDIIAVFNDNEVDITDLLSLKTLSEIEAQLLEERENAN